MTSITFDTPGYSENMEQAGFSREQANAMAKANAEAFQTMIGTQEFATKQDIKDVRNDLERLIAEAKHDILKWMVTAMIAQTALLVGIIAFLR